MRAKLVVPLPAPLLSAGETVMATPLAGLLEPTASVYVVGGGGVVVPLDEPPQPLSPPKHRLSAMAHATEARIRFIRIPRLQHI